MPDNAPAPLPDVLAGPLLRRLEPGRLVLWLVASGELVKLFEREVNDGRQYYLCRRANSELSSEGNDLYDWIKRSLIAV